ncbi:hypothetical protein PV326_008635 [Microctonus aethiopoides]|nr:hypothetical protein PV326_008635 [Microctonus aethiopoides]
MLDLKSSGTTAAELPRTTAFTNLSMLFADASSSYKGGWSHATSPAPGQVLTRHRTRKTCVQEGELKEEEEEEEEKEVVKEVVFTTPSELNLVGSTATLLFRSLLFT